MGLVRIVATLKHKLCACLLAVQTIALAQPQSDALALNWLGAPQALSQLQACAPGVQPTHLERWRAAQGSVSTFLDAASSRFVAVTRDVWVCLSVSPSGFTVFPLEALQYALEIRGVSADKTLPLMRSLQADLANTGLAKAMLALNGERRMLVYLTTEPGADTQFTLRTSVTELSKVNLADFVNALAEVPAGVVTRSGGENGRVDILQGRLSPRPLRGHYLQIPGTARTAAYEFTGTVWQSIRSPAEQVSFEPGGVAIHRKRKSSTLGSWSKEGGALYFEDKNLFMSGALIDLAGSLVMDVDVRRPAFRLPYAAGNQSAGSSEMPEIRLRNGYFLSTDKVIEAQTKEGWNRSAAQTREALEAQRQQRLKDVETADWPTQRPRGGVWSLCVGSLFNEVTLLADLQNTRETELCRTFIGTRKAWQEVLQQGCNGRCLEAHLPTGS